MEIALNNAYCCECRVLFINFAKIILLGMRLIFSLAIFMFSMVSLSQTVWEKPDTGRSGSDAEESREANTNADAGYLAGAVPEVDGRVEWRLDVDVPGKGASQIYDIMYDCLTGLTRADNQLEGSCIALVNKQDHVIVANVREWLVFTDKLLVSDRTKFNYTLIAYCSDGRLTLTMNRISYRYEENRVKGGHVYKAEEWITDGSALNRKKTRLLPGTGKFRRKTIDRKNYIFNAIRETVLK